VRKLRRKKVSNKLAKDIALSAMAVESARIGEAILSGNILNSTSSTSSSGTVIY